LTGIKENIMEVAKLTDITRVYKIGEVETHALRGVDLTIGEKEFTTLVGPSGSGKTTLLQLIGCLDMPTTGKVFINGQEATSMDRNQRADLRKGTIGFIFQFFALVPTLTAYENVELPLLLMGEKNHKGRVMELRRTPPRPTLGRTTTTRRSRPSACFQSQTGPR
jgi:putative ABC transport system ATP-binding protein